VPRRTSGAMTNPSRLRRILLTMLALAVVAGVVAGFASGDKITTLHVVTANEHITTLDNGPGGKSPGDQYVFDASVLSASGGKVLGRVRGTQTEVKLEHGVETVEGLLTFELGAGNEIVVGGLSAYPRTGTGLISSKRYVRAVLGGTGKYAGATGTVTSEQLPHAHYDQVFHLSF
jgi:hypothetical protein